MTVSVKKRHWRLEVVWEDSSLWHEGWEQVPELLKKRDSVRCMSVGLVLADDAKGLVLASSVHGTQAAGVIYIPKRAVVKRRRLK